MIKYVSKSVNRFEKPFRTLKPRKQFKIFKQLEFVFEKEQIDNVLTTEHTSFNFVKENTLEFAGAHALDLKWYYCFFFKNYRLF